MIRFHRRKIHRYAQVYLFRMIGKQAMGFRWSLKLLALPDFYILVLHRRSSYHVPVTRFRSIGGSHDIATPTGFGVWELHADQWSKLCGSKYMVTYRWHNRISNVSNLRYGHEPKWKSINSWSLFFCIVVLQKWKKKSFLRMSYIKSRQAR